MKTLLTTFTLVFTLMFSPTSFAEWTKVVVNVKGNTSYVDFEGIRKVDEYVYFWYVVDFFEPNNGYLSINHYVQGDCEIFRFKYLSLVFHRQPMGRDIGRTVNPENPGWDYPPPDTSGESILKSVCNH